ncbi:MAG: hypothetical protein JNL57_08360 [Bacteroidetes bacterium]|nr:hypothetical protein [Bacteroidota bacterium]
MATVTAVNAQIPGNWAPDPGGTGTTTLTNSAVGIGIGIPAGWQEIRFCNAMVPVKGLVVTATDYCSSGGPPGGGTIGGDIGGPGTGGDVPYIPISASLPSLPVILPSGMGYGTVNRGEPLFLVRDLTAPGNIMPNPTPAMDNARFLVLPDGSTGINSASPRAMLDVMGGSTNKPTAIFGQKARNVNLTVGTAPNTISLDHFYSRHIALYSGVSAGTLNSLTQQGDLVISYTDGQGQTTTSTGPGSGPAWNGTNASAGLAIVPMNGSGGGLRMDAAGNVLVKGDFELQGKLKCNGLLAKPKWWPDFVFEKDYNLITLDSLKHYINNNKHLPDFPSMDEILKSGQDVCNLQQLQQQKIEELVLYLIWKNEQIQFLEQKVDGLSEKINELSNRESK